MHSHQIRCRQCGEDQQVYLRAGFHGAKLPTKCPSMDSAPTEAGQQDLNNADRDKCPPNPFLIIPDQSEYWDQQEIKLQELPEDVPLGDMPRAVVCLLNRGLVDSLQPGNRVTIVGVTVNQKKVECRLRRGLCGGVVCGRGGLCEHNVFTNSSNPSRRGSRSL